MSGAERELKREPMAGTKKERLDRLLVRRGLAETRERAQAIILSGAVEVDGVRADKAGKTFPQDASILLKETSLKYVGRGGLKLEAALNHFQTKVEGRIALDVGASTGGFTDCLLDAGAKKVIAIDVGYGQLDMKLRNDERVVLMERCNARHLTPDDLPGEPADLAVIDVSFISLKIILPAVYRLIVSPREIVALVKPQFEVGKKDVGKGGIVKDPALHERVLDEIASVGAELGLHVSSPYPSPVRGTKGNQEYFLRFME